MKVLSYISVVHVKVLLLVGAFNQEKAMVWAFSVIVIIAMVCLKL